MIGLFSKYVAYPLWEWKEGAVRLRELRALERTQWWPTAEITALQERRLRNQLEHLWCNNDFYRARLLATGYERDEPPFDALRRMPLLSKKEIQDEPTRLFSKPVTEENLVMAKTGGSTGTALTVWFDKRCQQMRNAAAYRSDRWAGWDLGVMKASVWGNPPPAESLKKRIRRLLLERNFYLDTMRLDDASFAAFVNNWRLRKPKVLFGHAHSLFVLARYLEDHRIGDVKPQGIVATSMMLLPQERRVIERVFSCRVTDRYGCEEVGLIACECAHGRMHINAEHLVVELIRADGKPAEPGEEGEVVVSDLNNRAMPLIRYRVGDIGVAASGPCTCGRGLPVIGRITGRTADFLKRTDGSMVAGVSLVERTLTAIEGIEQMQLVQSKHAELTVHVVAGGNYTEESRRRLVAELQYALGGDVEIDVRRVAAIPQEPSGKFRFAKCLI